MTVDHNETMKLAQTVISKSAEVTCTPQEAAEDLALAYIDLMHEYKHMQCRMQAQNIELLNAVAQMQAQQIKQAGSQVVVAKPTISPLNLGNHNRG